MATRKLSENLERFATCKDNIKNSIQNLHLKDMSFSWNNENNEWQESVNSDITNKMSQYGPMVEHFTDKLDIWSDDVHTMLDSIIGEGSLEVFKVVVTVNVIGAQLLIFNNELHTSFLEEVYVENDNEPCAVFTEYYNKDYHYICIADGYETIEGSFNSAEDNVFIEMTPIIISEDPNIDTSDKCYKWYRLVLRVTPAAAGELANYSFNNYSYDGIWYGYFREGSTPTYKVEASGYVTVEGQYINPNEGIIGLTEDTIIQINMVKE